MRFIQVDKIISWIDVYDNIHFLFNRIYIPYLFRIINVYDDRIFINIVSPFILKKKTYNICHPKNDILMDTQKYFII